MLCIVKERQKFTLQVFTLFLACTMVAETLYLFECRYLDSVYIVLCYYIYAYVCYVRARRKVYDR